MGGDEDDFDWDTEDLIPGDNDKPSPTPIDPNYPDAPDNLTRIPSQPGSGSVLDVPITPEVQKP